MQTGFSPKVIALLTFLRCYYGIINHIIHTLHAVDAIGDRHMEKKKGAIKTTPHVPLYTPVWC